MNKRAIEQWSGREVPQKSVILVLIGRICWARIKVANKLTSALSRSIIKFIILPLVTPCHAPSRFPPSLCSFVGNTTATFSRWWRSSSLIGEIKLNVSYKSDAFLLVMMILEHSQAEKKHFTRHLNLCRKLTWECRRVWPVGSAFGAATKSCDWLH